MQFLLDVQAIAGSSGYSNRPWVLPSSSNGDGENDSYSSSFNLGWEGNDGRTIRERHWKAKYALYSICSRNEEESTNNKKQQSSGEDKDNNEPHLCADRKGGFECEMIRGESTGSKCNTAISSEKQGKYNYNKRVLPDKTAVEEEEGTVDDSGGRRIACLLSVPFACDVGDLLEAVNNNHTWVVEELQTFLDPGEDGYKYCASIIFADSTTAESFVKAVRGWEWQSADGSSIKAVLLMEPPRISTVGVGQVLSTMERLPGCPSSSTTTLTASPDTGQEEQKINQCQSCYSQKMCSSSIGPSTDSVDVLMEEIVVMETGQDKQNAKCESERPTPSWLKEKGNNAYVRALPMCPVCLDCLDPLALGLFPEPTMEDVLEGGNVPDMKLEKSEASTCGASSPPWRRCCQKRRRQGPGSLCAWSGSTCHVCKILTSMDSGRARICGVGADHQQAPQLQTIFCNDGDCSIAHNLWLCLVCCHVGCGRYTHEHAKSHFSFTGHSYSLELSTGRVWDYYGDRFTHRVLREGLPHCNMEFNALGGMEAEGSSKGRHSSSLQQPDLLLPLPPSSSSSSSERNNMTVMKEKLARVAGDYEELLASQLQEQTEYYENLIARMTAANTENRAVASGTTTGPSNEEEAEVLRLRKDISGLNERHKTAMRLLREAQEEARRLRSENSEMIRAQHSCKARVESITRAVTSSEMKNRRIVAELNRQLQDLNFYLRAQAEVQSSSQREDLEKGKVITEENDNLIEAANFRSSRISRGDEGLIPSADQLTRHNSESCNTIRERLQRRLNQKRRTGSYA